MALHRDKGGGGTACTASVIAPAQVKPGPSRDHARTLGCMRRRAIESSAIAAVGYDRDTAVLEIEFRSGDVYEYFAVPPSVYDGLLAAESAGRYFQARIRDVYPDRQKR